MLTVNLEFHWRTKHIELRDHWIRKKIESKEIVITYISTKDTIPDVLTET